MQFNPMLGFLNIGMLTVCSSCQQDQEASPTPLTTGRVVKIETTRDGQNLNPRPRWVIDVAPLSFEGNWPGHTYAQVKAFNLPDTSTYAAGKTISFHYQLVPVARQTPWKTAHEWHTMAPVPGGADPFAELMLSNVQLVQP